MKKLTFHGFDASNEISLLEYGLLVSLESHEDNSGTRFAIYRQDQNHFGTGHFSEKDLNNILTGEDWANEKDLKSFFSFIGCTDRNTYINTAGIVNKLSDLISYFGTDNICGTDYSPMTENEAKERYLN